MFLLNVMYIRCQQKLHKNILKVSVNMELGISGSSVWYRMYHHHRNFPCAK